MVKVNKSFDDKREAERAEHINKARTEFMAIHGSGVNPERIALLERTSGEEFDARNRDASEASVEETRTTEVRVSKPTRPETGDNEADTAK